MTKWLYKEGEEPKIFKGEDAIEDALENGWVDSPKGFKKVAEAVEPTGDAEVVSQTIDTFSDDEIGEEAIKRGILKQEIPLSQRSDDEILATFEEIKQECISRELEIEEVIPHDIDGDGEGDIDLNTLDQVELYELAKAKGLNVVHNTGKEKLIKAIQEAEEA
jgi:hypothetical protein